MDSDFSNNLEDKTQKDVSDLNPVISLDKEMEKSYLDYAMSVIVSRALPDLRDGLKPVHRRILYAMYSAGYHWNKPYKKSARVVGDVIGKFHPHGDQAVYDALVRMAQNFSLRIPLIDGQGNFGSVDGDPPAAMRYTEVRMNEIASFMMTDIEKDVVSFRPNYDDNEQEPTVLPAMYPNLFINGSGGIAVGMATNIPPHNLSEIINASVAYLENPSIDINQLLKIVKGPDFPTGGEIVGDVDWRNIYESGRGSITIRGRSVVEPVSKNKNAIIITDIPYQVNKSSMIEKIADLVKNKKIDGITDIRDESNKEGIRVVIELKNSANPQVVLNRIYKYTPLQTSFGCNFLALSNGKPISLGLKKYLQEFANFREEVIINRTNYDLKRAESRVHILGGLAIAISNIDEIISIIKKSPEPSVARDQLLKKKWKINDLEPILKLLRGKNKSNDIKVYVLSIEQIKSILDLKLQRLTAIGREEIKSELQGLNKKIYEYKEILSNRKKLISLMINEIKDLITKFPEHVMKRRTGFSRGNGIVDEEEELIQMSSVIIVITREGYIKRMPLSSFKAQKRGGKGKVGATTRESDFVSKIYVATTLTPMLFFSDKGIVYQIKTHKLPEATLQSRGKAIVNLLPTKSNESISIALPLPQDKNKLKSSYVIFLTQQGFVRRNQLSDFEKIRPSGIIAMKLHPGDKIIGVAICSERDDILLTTKEGKAIRFPVKDIRIFKSRASSGIRGIKLKKNDQVLSLMIVNHIDASYDELKSYLRMASFSRKDEMSDSEPVDDNEGVKVKISPEKYSELVASEQFILAITEKGYGKRSSLYEYRTTKRGGSGIIAMKLTDKNGKIASSFPINTNDDIMLISDQGRAMRTGVSKIRIGGRNTQGVKVFSVSGKERVTSADKIEEQAE